VSQLGTFVLIPEEWHQPLLQRMVLMENAGEVANAFYDYLQAEPARVVFREYGFVLPGEEQ
jgi:molybdate transport system substrate-binding protein